MKKFDGLETKQKWCVVIDTCNIEGDFRLRSGGLLYLLHACRATNVQVYFPRVCVSDLIAHYHIKSAESLKAYKQAYAELDRYVYKGRPPPFFEGLGQLDENYDNWLLKRIKELRISILDYPNITHEKIITRATGKKRPFTNHDRGYKDTLIWESVLELLQSRNSHVIFINT